MSVRRAETYRIPLAGCLFGVGLWLAPTGFAQTTAVAPTLTTPVAPVTTTPVSPVVTTPVTAGSLPSIAVAPVLTGGIGGMATSSVPPVSGTAPISALTPTVGNAPVNQTTAAANAAAAQRAITPVAASTTTVITLATPLDANLDPVSANAITNLAVTPSSSTSPFPPVNDSLTGQSTGAYLANDNAQLSTSQTAQNTAALGGAGTTINNAVAAQSRLAATFDNAPATTAVGSINNTTIFGQPTVATIISGPTVAGPQGTSVVSRQGQVFIVRQVPTATTTTATTTSSNTSGTTSGTTGSSGSSSSGTVGSTTSTGGSSSGRSGTSTTSTGGSTTSTGGSTTTGGSNTSGSGTSGTTTTTAAPQSDVIGYAPGNLDVAHSGTLTLSGSGTQVQVVSRR